MEKFPTLFFITLLLAFTLVAHATRAEHIFSATSPENQLKVTYGEKADQAVEESCEEVAEEECMMRRNLAAHLDYIYTQNHKP